MTRIGNPILDSTRLMLKRASKKSGANIWLRSYKDLSKPISRKPKVNIGKISHLTEKGAVVFIPGKVLGGGTISHNIIIGAYSYTKSAADKIVNAGGEVLFIPEFLERYSSGKNVILIGG